MGRKALNTLPANKKLVRCETCKKTVPKSSYNKYGHRVGRCVKFLERPDLNATQDRDSDPDRSGGNGDATDHNADHIVQDSSMQDADEVESDFDEYPREGDEKVIRQTADWFRRHLYEPLWLHAGVKCPLSVIEFVTTMLMMKVHHGMTDEAFDTVPSLLLNLSA